MEIKLNKQTIYYGDALSNEDVSDLLNKHEAQPMLSDVEIVFSPYEIKSQIRQKIAQTAGDTESLLGTTADGTQLALYMLAELLDAINTAQTLGELKTAIQPQLPLAQQYLQEVASGAVVPTFTVKGVEAVVADVKDRSTKVATVLKDAAKATL